MKADNNVVETGGVEVDNSLLPHIKKKYLIILILLGVLAVMLPSYQTGWMLVVSYILCVVLGLIMLVLYTEYNFQKYHRKCRPFIVTSISQKISIVWLVFAIVTTISIAASSGEWVPYIVFWALVGAVVLNHFQIFGLANQHKHKYPDRCEFC